MKHFNTVIIYVLMLTTVACKKEAPDTPIHTTGSQLIRSFLHTAKDPSIYNNTIVCRLFPDETACQTLCDPTSPPMCLKNIPNHLRKLIAKRRVPYHESIPMEPNCTAQNIGDVRFFDSSYAGQIFKKIIFRFNDL